MDCLHLSLLYGLSSEFWGQKATWLSNRRPMSHAVSTKPGLYVFVPPRNQSLGHEKLVNDCPANIICEDHFSKQMPTPQKCRLVPCQSFGYSLFSTQRRGNMTKSHYLPKRRKRKVGAEEEDVSEEIKHWFVDAIESLQLLFFRCSRTCSRSLHHVL